MIRKYIVVKGVVQGVGFRPFVYKIAVNNNLKGWVNNNSKGVYIDLEGKEDNIEEFMYRLQHEAPPLSKINEVYVEERPVKNYTDFEIRYSSEEGEPLALIPPDISICNQCLEEIKDPLNRRYRYPFTNCTNCGPRFSIIKKLPYDRPVTTMNDFKMCSRCEDEYKNPLDRRFHAEPNGCPNCGPRLFLLDNLGNEIKCKDEIKEAISMIKKGKILAVKGIGGFNLVCDGNNAKAINILRNRKRRPRKPLAVMMKDLNVVKKYCLVNEIEEKVLTSNKRPILILDKVEKCELPGELAPNNDTIGVMLPYTPLHYLLFEEHMEVLVMTSANISGQPMIYENNEAILKLNKIVDYFLINNRDIHIPVDDSVCRVILGEERVIRAARGYTPISIDLNKGKKVVAYGSQLKNTFAIANEERVFISQYIGDMDNLETLDSFEKSLSHFKNLYKIEQEVIAYDMHPDYWCNDFVRNENIEKVSVQHHHAHVVSCMVENKIEDKVIGVALDGTGYGEDGRIWGSEFLVCDYKDFKRVGHLNYFHIPGGESSIKEPWKILIGLLYKIYNKDMHKFLPKSIDIKKVRILEAMILGKINSPLCSSMGRLFDGVAVLLGFNECVSFEGEAAIYLQSICEKREEGFYHYTIDYIDNKYLINTDEIIIGIIEDLRSDINKGNIAKKFHNTVINIIIKVCSKIRGDYGINKVALSGGVFNNEIILKGAYKGLASKNFNVYIHKKIPCNDSGISLGQLIIGRERLKGGLENVHSGTS